MSRQRYDMADDKSCQGGSSEEQIGPSSIPRWPAKSQSEGNSCSATDQLKKSSSTRDIAGRALGLTR